MTEQLSNIKYKRFSVTKNFIKGANNAITISGVQGVLRYSNNLHVLPASPVGASGAYNEGMLAHLVITSGNIVQLWLNTAWNNATLSVVVGYID
nr:MAG TPA: hypothetical protein [Caudoviricetes sp.]